MSDSADIRGLLNQAAAAGAAGDLPRAEECCREALALDPRNSDALGLMGMVRWHGGDAEGGEKFLRQSLDSLPAQAQVLANLGDLLLSRQEHNSALECYAESVRVAPEYAEAWLKLGIARGEKGDIQAAMAALERCRELRPRDLRALYAMAQAHLEGDDHEQAIACYRQALAIEPEAVEVHDALNEILWEHAMVDDYLGSFAAAIEAAPGSLPLRLRYAGSLSHVGKHRDAEAVLLEAEGLFGSDAGIHAGMGASLDAQGRVSAAIAAFSAALEMDPESLQHRQDLARVLISTGDFPGALEHIDAAMELAPLDQRNLAFRGLCWRLSGDPRAATINDYGRFVKRYEIPVPAGYSDIRAFNHALVGALDTLHKTQAQHPLNQTLRGGTQTHGNLFERKIKEVQQARASIEQCVHRYIEEMDDDSEHPFLSRKRERFRFSGSWSCRLGQQGFHTNHIHMEGWISSSYYVSLPGVVGAGDGHAGWIKFGETNLNLGEREHIGKILEPKEGHLVLFPSYMFHGTVPFPSNEVRTTIAFDVMPV
jgi:tetratricopeptide (TPR) repeat protein